MTATAPPPLPPDGRDATDAGDCPRCGAQYAATQEYCLECGLRLPAARGVDAAFADARAGGPILWAWPVLVTLVVAVLATAAVAVVQSAAEDEGPQLVATTEQPTIPTVTELVPTEPVPTTTTPTLTQIEPPPPPAPPPAAPAGRLIRWPAGVDGYTVVLSSLPAPGGRTEATAKARAAADAGLQDVGVLDSSRFSSLHPGYYVVFSGVYGSLAEAQRFVDDAHGAGFDTAYARLIAS